VGAGVQAGWASASAVAVAGRLERLVHALGEGAQGLTESKTSVISAGNRWARARRTRAAP
jgi:hypothetical protein